MRNRILIGDVRERLQELPDGSVHCCVTSPPYFGLRSYGTAPQAWGGDPRCAHEWGDYFRRDARGTGDSTLHSPVPPAVNRIDRVGSICSRCGAWRGELGSEPSPEMYVEHLVEVFREVRRGLRKDGTLWLVLGDSYASAWACSRRNLIGNGSPADGRRAARPNRLHGGLKEKDLCGVPWRVALALQADGWYLRSDIIWAKNAPMPENVRDRPTKAHEYVFFFAKNTRYYYDATAIAEACTGKEPLNGRRKRNPEKFVQHVT